MPPATRVEESERARRTQRPVDLELIVKRARWKATACRWSVERPTLTRDQSNAARVRERDDALRIQHLTLDDCFAWMLEPSRRTADPATLSRVADCYDNVALSAETILRLAGKGALEPSPPASLLYLLAEAQSALLRAVDQVGLRGDSDQRDLFLWLKDQTTRHRIYVDRHMRLDDPADHDGAADLRERIERAAESILERDRLRRLRADLAKKIRYHAGRVRSAQGRPEDEMAALGEAARTWIDAGFAPSEAVLDELRAVRDAIPGALPESAARMIESSARRAPATVTVPEPKVDADDPEVMSRASSLLAGRVATVFIDPQMGQGRIPLEEWFELRSVRWVALSPDEAEQQLEAEIRREDVDVVLIAVRLSATIYSTFRRLCQEHRTPFVRLAGNQGPQDVALRVLRQVGGRLQPAGAPAD